MKLKSKPVALSLYFGIPGAGKSTYAAYLAKQDMKKGRKVWSNFGITGAMKCDKSDFGKYMMTDGRLIIDEAGLEYDNRKMSMTNDEIYFFKYHRHYQLDVDFFSQGLDVDIKIRKLARHIYLIKPSLLPFFIKRKEIAGGKTGNGGTQTGGSTEPPKRSSTRKYVCPCCKQSIRATKEVNIICGDCMEKMEVAE